MTNTMREAFASLEGYLENLNTDKAAMVVLKTYTDRLHSHYMANLKVAIDTTQQAYPMVDGDAVERVAAAIFEQPQVRTISTQGDVYYAGDPKQQAKAAIAVMQKPANGSIIEVSEDELVIHRKAKEMEAEYDAEFGKEAVRPDFIESAKRAMQKPSEGMLTENEAVEIIRLAIGGEKTRSESFRGHAISAYRALAHQPQSRTAADKLSEELNAAQQALFNQGFKLLAADKLVDELVGVGQAVIDSWESPLWKVMPAIAEYIARLRVAVESARKYREGK